MPERAAYDEAIRLSQARLKVQDPELTGGAVEKFTVQTTIGGMERPWGLEGGFAVVYKFSTRSGNLLALRCFRVSMSPDMQFRYERIGHYFATHIPTISARFKYHENGIIVKENMQGRPQSTVYPLIEMEWVKGVTLIEYIDELCQKRDQARLKELGERWIDLLWTLRQAHISHGDLSGGNVMVREDGRLVLVDYDGVYIPEFASAGLIPLVVGQADYQHPQMHQRPFNEYTDDFSALVIYVAILSLQAQPQIWDKYTQRSAEGKLMNTNILFLQQDFVDPEHSTLINDLERIGDERTRKVLHALKTACKLPVDQMRFPLQIIDPEYEKKAALQKLEQVLQSDDDNAIIKIWDDSSLATYPPAQRYKPRLERARQTIQALKHLRAMLQSGNIQNILAAYDPLLQNNTAITKEEQRLIIISQSIDRALKDDNDQALNAAYNEIQSLNYSSSFQFTTEEDRRITLARWRVKALSTFRKALTNISMRQLVSAYDEILDTSQAITQAERSQLQMARDFIRAYDTDDDQEIVSLSTVISQSSTYTKITFTQQERERIERAKKRLELWEKLQHALLTKRPQELALVYDPEMEHMKAVNAELLNVLQSANQFVQAYQDDDDQALASVGQELQEPRYQPYFLLTEAEKQRISLAVLRRKALIKFRQAVMSKRAEQILANYDPLLADCKNVTQDEHALLSLAQDLVYALRDDNDETLAAIWNDIQQSRYQKSLLVTPLQEQRLTLAKQRVAALTRFRTEVELPENQREAQRVIAAYDPILDDCQSVSAEERALLKSAHTWITMYQALQSALQSNNDQQLIDVYDETLARAFVGFSSSEEERFKRIQKFVSLKQALDSDNDREAIILAQEIEVLSRKPLNDPVRINHARRRFIKRFEAEQVEGWLLGEDVTVRWRWPDDELIRFIIIVWREDRWPDHPKKEVYDTGRERFSRPRNEQITTRSFHVGKRGQIFLQAFLAIVDDSHAPAVWFYSQGVGPTSRFLAYQYNTHLKQG